MRSSQLDILKHQTKIDTQDEQVVFWMRVIEYVPSLVLPVDHDELVLLSDVGRTRQGAIGRIGALLSDEKEAFAIEIGTFVKSEELSL